LKEKGGSIIRSIRHEVIFVSKMQTIQPWRNQRQRHQLEKKDLFA